MPEPVEGPCATCGQRKPGWLLEGDFIAFNCVGCIVATLPPTDDASPAPCAPGMTPEGQVVCQQHGTWPCPVTDDARGQT